MMVRAKILNLGTLIGKATELADMENFGKDVSQIYRVCRRPDEREARL